MLPRLIIAVIMVQLAVPIAGLIIDISNILGIGVGALLQSAIGGNTNILLDFSFTGGEDTSAFIQNAFLQSGAVAVGATQIGAILWAGITILPTIGIVVLAVILTLIIRKALIIALVIFAPIAFVFWVFPNTDKIAKQWFDVFIKAAFMFPLIMIFLASGKILAEIVSTGGDGNNIFDTITTLILYFAPYALIPFTYRFAGGAISAIGNGFRTATARVNGGGGGGGGGAGGLTGRWKGAVNRYRDRTAAGQSTLSRTKGVGNSFRKGAQRGFRSPGSRTMRYLQEKGVGTESKVMSGWAKSANRIEGRANATFGVMQSQALDQLKQEGLIDDRDALKAISRGNFNERPDLKHLDTPEARSAAAVARAQQGFIGGGYMEEYTGIAQELSKGGNTAVAQTTIRRMAESAGKSGRHAQSVLRYDPSSEKLRFDDGDGGYTDDYATSMQQYVAGRTPSQLANTHDSSADEVFSALSTNIQSTDPARRQQTVQQVGEILASRGVDPEFRQQLQTLADTNPEVGVARDEALGRPVMQSQGQQAGGIIQPNQNDPNAKVDSSDLPGGES